MKKIVVIALIFILSLFGTVWASPLMDYDAGKGSIDLIWRNTKIDVTGATHANNLPYKDNFDASITLGLGNNLAFQYREFKPESPVVTHWNFNGVTTSGQFKLTSQEFNILYKLNKNISAFAGDVSAQGYRWTAISSYTTQTKNLWQVGLVGQTSIAPKTNLWASVAAGTDLTNWEIGLSYQFAPRWEFNVNYREIKTNNLTLYQVPDNVKTVGFGYGITYKF